MEPAVSDRPNASFAKWLAAHEAAWAGAWAKALQDYDAVGEAEREAFCQEGARAFVARMVDGEDRALRIFCGEPARKSSKRRISVVGRADALDAGRVSILGLLAESKIPQKAAAKELVEETFRRAMRHLLESLQVETGAPLAPRAHGGTQSDRQAREWQLPGQLDLAGPQEVQRSLERTQELISSILDASVSAIVSTDTFGRITLANRAAERIFGRTERDLVGTAAGDYYVGGRREAFRLMRHLLKAGALRDWETSFIGAGGLTVPIRLTAALLKDERGVVVGTMGSAKDISIEESLRREVANRNGYLLSILHGSADGLVTVDARGKVASWNRGASQLLGIRPEEALGRTLDEIFDPAKVRPLAEPAVHSQGSRRFEYRVESPGGGHDLLVSRTEITGAGEPGASIVLKDVTELKRLQRDLAEAEHLAELGRLAASIAHEIKNPIAGLRGAMEMMGGVHAEQDPRFAVFREALTQIRRLDALVKDLLAYARPVRIKTEPVPVHLLVEASLMLVKEPLSEAKLILESEVSEDLPPAQADPILMQQVLVNLLMNAIQATPPGGRIHIGAQGEPSGFVSVTISDDGCGISSEVRENIFKPFFTTKHVGTGLGLSIVQRLLRAHGGYCEVASEEGKGTVLTVHLPSGVRRG